MTDLKAWREAFRDEALYAEHAWFVHELVDLDPNAHTLTACMDTREIGWLVDAQHVLDGHPSHLPAAVAIQATGTLGQLYAVFALGLRRSEGWVGFGTHIHKARFRRMGLIGPTLTMRLTCKRKRVLMGTVFCEIEFSFEQDGEIVYESTQSAGWRNPTQSS